MGERCAGWLARRPWPKLGCAHGHAIEQLRLGTGAGFSADRLEPAVELVAKGRLDAIVFECIGERTLAFGHRDRLADPGPATTRCSSGGCARCCRSASSTAPG